jgi:hypothetical protein
MIVAPLRYQAICPNFSKEISFFGHSARGQRFENFGTIKITLLFKNNLAIKK